MPRSQHDRSAGDWHEVFLATLANTGNVRAAINQSGVNRTHAYDVKAANKEFSDKWDEAHANALDLLEAEGWRRALAGRDDRGSAQLLIKMLEGAHPEKYGRRAKITHQGDSDGGPMRVTFTIGGEGEGSDADAAQDV